ncbi:MAG: signal peptidase II [Acidimicrobiales bacterium]
MQPNSDPATGGEAHGLRVRRLAGIQFTHTSAAKHGFRRWILLAGVAAVVIAVDQVTKSLAVANLRDHSIHVIGPLWLRLSYNTGAAFGIGQGWTAEIAVIAVALIGVLIVIGRSASTTMGVVGVGLMLGGAAGNLVDRIFASASGAVVDFFYTGFWPTFNVADSCIVCGSILLVITMSGVGKKAPHGSADQSS